MSFAENTGYIPSTIPELMSYVREGVNEQFGTSYDEETFLGTNFYKYFYALVQRLQLNEIKTSEIFLYMQQYFVTTNEEIRRPNTTHPGLLDIFEDAGYLVSTKAPADADAGKLYVCVDVDENADSYPAKKLEICTILKNSVVAGVVTQGSESESITLSNLQSFDFKFNLPTRIRTYLKLTITLSDNNTFSVGDVEDVKEALLANINARYRLGLNFEPQRYFSVLDAPWASAVLLEYSDDNATWLSAVAALDYDELFTFSIADISVVEV
jgi:hypothetical protein